MNSIVFLLNTDLQYNIRAVKTIKSLSIDYRVLVFLNGENNYTKLLEGNINVIVFDISTYIKHGFLDKHFFIGNEFDHSFSKIIEIVKKYEIAPACIYSVDLQTLKTGFRLSQFFKSKLVYDAYELYVETINQYYPLHRKSPKIVLYMAVISLSKFINIQRERRFIKSADLFITTCDSFLTYYKNRYQINYSCIIRNTPVYIGYEEINEANLYSEFNVPQGRKVIIYIGTFNAGRSLDKLVLSAKFINENYYILLLGLGPLYGYLKDLVDKNNLNDKVGVFGPYEMHLTSNYSKSAALGVLLTDRTNLSKFLASANKVFDFMQSGVPVLLSGTPENIKILEHAKNGKYIDNITPQNIAKAINEMLESQLLTNYKENGLQYYRENGHWGIDEKKLLTEIKILIESQSNYQKNSKISK